MLHYFNKSENMKNFIAIILLFFVSLNVFSKPISLNFNDIPIRQALQFVAEASNTNIIISDSVKGNMTLHLEHLPSEEAFAIILQEAGLGEQTQGNVILISPLQELAQKEWHVLPVYTNQFHERGMKTEVVISPSRKAVAIGRTRQEAEEKAARLLVRKIRQELLRRSKKKSSGKK